MIQPNELRVGNWIKPYLSDNPVQVTAIDHDIESFDGYFCRYDKGSITLVDEDNDGWCEPVQITPEILSKAGFKHQDILKKVYHKNVYIWNRMRVNEIEGNKYYYGELEIKSLHQLQNLYFALTGKELEIQL